MGGGRGGGCISVNTINTILLFCLPSEKSLKRKKFANSFVYFHAIVAWPTYLSFQTSPTVSSSSCQERWEKIPQI